MSGAAVLALALVIDVCLGWPESIHRRIGHPVTWLGRLVDALERQLNARSLAFANRLAGALTVVLVIALSAGLAHLVVGLLPRGVFGIVAAAILAWPWLAARSLQQHVHAVALPLIDGDLVAARRQVARIVGRDPEKLDVAGVGRAAMESLAENASDGVIAPIFWGVLLGVPGLVGYKALNTMDSMIGHRNERYETFGWAAARLDDLANLIPARLTGLLFAAASRNGVASLAAMWRDARKHRSPNAGWPEAAMAGALGVRLSGPRVYGERATSEPWLNAAAPDPVPADLTRALALYWRALMLATLVLVGLVWI